MKDVQFADNTIALEETSWIVYGDSGIGKTTLARYFPSPLFLMMRGGGEHRPLPLVGSQIPFVEVSTRAQLDQIVLDLRSSGMPKLTLPPASARVGANLATPAISPPFQPKTLVIDQLPSLYEMLMSNVLRTVVRVRGDVKGMNIPEIANQQDYGHVRRLIINFMTEVNAIPNMHKVYLCLAELDKDSEGRVLSGGPGIAGKLTDDILKFVDFVLRMHVRREMRGVPPHVHEFRALQTQPDGTWKVKDSSGKLPPYVESTGVQFDLFSYCMKEITK